MAKFGTGLFTMLSFRLPRAHAAMIDRAVEIAKEPRSEFMRNAVLKASEEIIVRESKQRKSRDA